MRFLFIAIFLSIYLASPANAMFFVGMPIIIDSQKVIEVSEGTTLKMGNGENIILALIAVPTTLGDNSQRGNDRRIRRANNRLEKLLKGQNVLIKSLSGAQDRYGKLSAVVSMFDTKGDGQDISTILLAEGLVALRHPEGENPQEQTLWESYLTIEDAARKSKLGIWAERAISPACEEEAKFKASRYAIIAGDIEAVSIQRDVIYINFTDNWREDFTVRLQGRGRNKLYKALAEKLQAGAWVEVRGWVSWTNGPMIDLHSVNQLRRLASAPAYCQINPDLN